MAKKRVKISAAYNDFSRQVGNLRNFDRKNQTNFSSGLLSKKQIHLLTESLFSMHLGNMKIS